MDNEKTVVSSMLWKFTERGAAQIFTLIVQIVLARLLSPEDFGTLAILLVFVNISNVLIQKGFASALVQKAEVSELDINTVLFFSEGIALLLYIILWFAAPFIESIYSTNNLALYLRVISLSLFFGSFYSIENSILIRAMRFKQLFFSSFLATIISGITGIVLAYMGAKCWALVIQNVVQQMLFAVLSFPFCRWKVKVQYSKESFQSLFGFGSKILLAEMLYTGVENLRTLLIGARYLASDLAYYDRGQTYPSVAMRSIYDTLSSVLLPVFSRTQNNIKILANETSKSLGISFYLVAPCFLGFAIIAEPFTEIFLSNKWIECVPYMRIFCVYQLGILPYCILRNVLYALGRSKESLKLEIIKAFLTLLSIFIGLQLNTISIAMFSTIAVWISTILYGICVGKYVYMDWGKIGRDFLRICIYCIGMLILISFVNSFIDSAIVELVIDVVFGGVLYILFSIITKDDYFKSIIRLLNGLVENWKKS